MNRWRSRFDDCEAPEYNEVCAVERHNRANSRRPVRGGKQSIEKSLSPKTVLPHPAKKLRYGGCVGKNLNHLGGVPDSFGSLQGGRHVQRIDASTRIGDNMRELSENLGCQRYILPGPGQSREHAPDWLYVSCGTPAQLRRRTTCQGRESSSISPSRSSSEVSSRNSPTSSGGSESQSRAALTCRSASLQPACHRAS